MLFFRPSIRCNGSEHFPFDSYGMPRFHGNILYTIYCILYHLAPVPAARPEPNGKTIERVNQLKQKTAGLLFTIAIIVILLPAAWMPGESAGTNASNPQKSGQNGACPTEDLGQDQRQNNGQP